jgi:hypothetical protein
MSKKIETKNPKKESQIVQDFHESNDLELFSAEDLLNEFENDLQSGKLGSNREEIMKNIEKKVKR